MRFVMQQPGSWSSGFWAQAQKEDGRDGGKGVNVCVCVVDGMETRKKKMEW